MNDGTLKEYEAEYQRLLANKPEFVGAVDCAKAVPATNDPVLLDIKERAFMDAFFGDVVFFSETMKGPR